MASLYWVGGTATWDATAGTKWATTSGGAGGAAVPTAADDVFLDAASGAVTVTVGSGAVARSIDCTGFTGTLAGSTAMSIGDSGGGGYKLVAGMSYSYTGILTFAATSDNGGTGWPVTTAGKSMPTTAFDGAGGKWVLQDSFTQPGASRSVSLNRGTLDTNSQTVNAGTFSVGGSLTRTLTLGSSAITLAGTSASTWSSTTITNLTMTSNTATVTFTGAGGSFNGTTGLNGNGLSLVFSGSGAQALSVSGGGSMTFANVTRTGTAAKTDTFTLSGTTTVTGTFTVTGNSTTNRLLVQSSTIGTARTINAATVSASNADFMDITGSGAASWDLSAITGGSGDCGGNSGITFTSSSTQTWAGGNASGSWSDVTKWTSRVPLPQDDVVIAQAFTSKTITMDMPRIGRSIDTSGSTGNPVTGTSSGIGPMFFGSLSLGATGLNPTTNQQWTAAGRGVFTISMAGRDWDGVFNIQAPGGTYTLQDALVSVTNINVTDGTFNTNNQSVTCNSFTAASNRATTLNLGSSVISLTATSTTTIWNTTGTATTLNAGTSEIVIASASANSRTFSTATSPAQQLATLTYTVAASSGVLIFQGVVRALSINTLNIGPAHNVRVFSGASIHVQNFNVNGTAGNLVTLDSSTAGTPGILSRQYVGPQGNLYSFFGAARAKDGYLDLDGSSLTYASTPNKPEFQISGDIDVRVLVGMDWNTPSGGILTGRSDAGNNRSWYLQSPTSARLPRFTWSTDGTVGGLITRTSTVALPNPGMNYPQWIMATLDLDDGAGQHVVRFYTCAGTNISPTFADFTLLDTVTTAGTTTLFAGTRILEVGSRNGGNSDLFTGHIYKAEVRDGIDGTIVASPDFTAQIINQQSYLSLKDSTAIGYGAWWANNSTNVSGNSGWRFNDGNYIGWGDPV